MGLLQPLLMVSHLRLLTGDLMLIHILREENESGQRVEDDVDESRLVKTEGLVDNENERTTWVEYRFPGSDVIVHRSCHVTLKKMPEGLTAIAASLG
jgi:hypothetical protein